MKSIDSYRNQDEDAVASYTPWREDLKGKAICCVIQYHGETKKQAEADDVFDTEQPELKICSSQAALSIVDDLNSF